MECQGQAVLIKPNRLPERTPTGQLVIPKTSKEMLPEWGTVTDHGPECKEIKKGMHLIFPRKSASVITIEGEDFFFTTEHKIFYMREKEKE